MTPTLATLRCRIDAIRIGIASFRHSNGLPKAHFDGWRRGSTRDFGKLKTIEPGGLGDSSRATRWMRDSRAQCTAPARVGLLPVPPIGAGLPFGDAVLAAEESWRPAGAGTSASH